MVKIMEKWDQPVEMKAYYFPNELYYFNLVNFNIYLLFVFASNCWSIQSLLGILLGNNEFHNSNCKLQHLLTSIKGR